MQKVSRRIAAIADKHLIVNRLWAPAAIMATIVVLSGSAGVQTGGWTFTGIDKLGHLVVFGLLGIALARSFKHPGHHRLPVFLVTVSIATGFGLLDEFHQNFNPLRTFEWADLLADFAGSLLASGLYIAWPPLRKLLEFEISGLLRLRILAKQ